MKASLGGRTLAVGILLTAGTPFWAAGKERADISLTEIQKILSEKNFVDLTHEFARGIPRWSGFPDEQRQTIIGTTRSPD